MALTVLQMLPSLKGGGVETGTVDLARHLVARGHRAIVISSGGPMVRELEAAGAIHYALPVHRKVPWAILPLSRRVAEVIESHGVDVIHARSRVPAIVGYLAWRRVAARARFRLGDRRRIPCFITTAHGHYSRQPFSRVMSWGRFVIANSERIARHMMDDFGVPPGRIRFIPRGVDLSRFTWREPRREAPRGEWVVSSIGRITPLKGHRDLLRAFAVVVKTFPRARLRVVGECPPRHRRHLEDLKGMVSQLGLEDRVEFTGFEPDVPGLLGETDLAVLSSSGEEAFGRVLIEAGACGVPVAATRVGGVPEVILDRRTGLLVPPEDPVALAAAMASLLKDRALACELARANRRRIESVYPVNRMVAETLEVYREAAERLRILVIKISAAGDVVLATPSLRALRQRFPAAHISVLVGRENRDLLNRCPYLDDLVVFDRGRDRTLPGLLRLGRRLRAAEVDLVVDFQNNRVSHWLGWLSRAPQRYGYAGRRWSGLLTHPAVHPAGPMPPVEHQLHLLQLLGIQGAPVHLELWPGPSDERGVDELLGQAWLAQSQPLVAVHPGARWPSKRWPEERYAELADRLAASAKARVVLTGSESERPLCDRIQHLARSKPVVAAGRTTLNEMAALLRRCGVFVGGDTAPLHIAAAVGTPLVAIFGPTDPARHLPPSRQTKLFQAKIPCSPCYRARCPRPGSGRMECMRMVTVEEVAEAALGWLRQPAEAPA
ncbi:MAG: lipopolysaccharide heptosyltransferase II [Candidatus Omnitrophica bacterium]|nr:lipopolysaccharide heptosyltransferase II [Candidatus Omnitrophota bacterium]